jgi:hypothetical protein
MSQAAKGRVFSVEHRTNIANANKSRHCSEITRAKMSLALTGRKRGTPSEETRLKLSKANSGKISPNKGIAQSAKHVAKRIAATTKTKNGSINE